MGNCCADVVVAAAGCGGILLEEVAFAETAVKWWRSFSFFIAFAMMIEVGGGGLRIYISMLMLYGFRAGQRRSFL